jgi:hypothetical protein
LRDGLGDDPERACRPEEAGSCGVASQRTSG